VSVLNLGQQALTGVFPADPEAEITTGPLELVKCHAANGDATCGLVQLRQSYDLGEMYGMNYGYRSGLNGSMVAHLEDIANEILSRVDLAAEDVVLDIGSNDATLLKFFSEAECQRIGIDPAIEKFRHHYSDSIATVPEFFSAAAYTRGCPDRLAKVVTSIAMFYDLPRPLEFVQQVREILAPDGIWVFEQSYLPLMLQHNAYDTVCHEHMEYYAFQQMEWMMERAGLKIIDATLNDTNGGSFRLTVARAESPHAPRQEAIETLRRHEQDEQLADLGTYERFAGRVHAHRDALRQHLESQRGQGRRVLGYGASTKGNVVLQFCGITAEEIGCIAEINEDKFGCYTPGTKIPIVSEAEAREMNPDCFMVLPWHFRDSIRRREAPFLAGGGTLLFPLPVLDEVEA
jgi:hypothetical protein